MLVGYHDNVLYLEGVSVAEIAERWGTPCYLYSRASIQQHWNYFSESLAGYPHQICYAVKANSNLAVLNILARLGSGFDIVSGGELKRVLAAGAKASTVVFSGVGKTSAEIQLALQSQINCFNIESFEELKRIEKIAQALNQIAPIAVRVNPDIPVDTNPAIATGKKENKFGVAIDEAYAIYDYAAQSHFLKIKGISCHLGSQITELQPFLLALEVLLAMQATLAKKAIVLEDINIGGGLGVSVQGQPVLSISDYCAALLDKLHHSGATLKIEPGRSMVASAGFLITRVQYLKKNSVKNFAIVDAAMNDLMRPALYQAWHRIQPVEVHSDVEEAVYDVVGPICESGDILGLQRSLKIKEDDLLIIYDCGAYGFSMSSNYNSRPRAAEVMVDGDYVYLVRPREVIEASFEMEQCLP